jgi:cytochrome c oxidase assembly protein subunit 11
MDIRHRKLIIKCLVAVVASTAFGFAMVPLYDVLCKVTGLNGKTSGQAATAQAVKENHVDMTRMITVELDGRVMQGLSWDFTPKEPKIKVHPGEVIKTAFIAKNSTNQTLTGQAIPSVSPGWAAQYFKKVECFCFRKQKLAPGEIKEMSLVFYVKPELPTGVTDMALTYSFFPIEDKEAGIDQK